jgi:hypothetical protein
MDFGKYCEDLIDSDLLRHLRGFVEFAAVVSFFFWTKSWTGNRQMNCHILLMEGLEYFDDARVRILMEIY